MSAILMDLGEAICIVSKGHLHTKIIPMKETGKDTMVVEVVVGIMVVIGNSSIHHHQTFVSNHPHFKGEDRHITVVRLADFNSGVGVHRWAEAVAISVAERVLLLNGEKEEKDQEILTLVAGVDVGDFVINF